MDQIRTVLWTAIRAHLPPNAEAVQRQGQTNLIISWTLPTEERPNRQSREISVRFDRAVSRVMEASDDARQRLVAERVAAFVRRVLVASRYDPLEELPSLIIEVDDRALE
jgi:hypothetical protein